MRRLLLAVPLLIPLCAQAQTTAANPVEPFSYGVRTGTAKNPLVAVLSSVVPSAQAGSTQAASPVELFSYGRRVGTQSNPIYVNLGNALDAYVTQTGLTEALNGYLTTSAAASTYLPLTGGTVSGFVGFSAGISTGNGQPITIHDAYGNWVNIIRSSSNGAVQFQFAGGLNDLQAGRFVMEESDYSPVTYSSLPTPPSGYLRLAACSDCYIGSGDKGIIVLYNGTSWVGVSGEAISH